MADVLEMLFALNEAYKHSKEELFQIYDKKHKGRGGFSDRIFLISKNKKGVAQKEQNNERMA